MNKIWLVISREYSTRVKKTSFWVLTLLVPILIVAIYATPILLSQKPLEKSLVLVVDETGLFAESFESSANIQYCDVPSLEQAKNLLQDSASAIVFIPSRQTTIPNDAFLYYQSQSPNMYVQSDVNFQLQSILRNNILLDVHNISEEDYQLITSTKINLRTQDLETGRDGFLEVKMVAGALLAILVFIVIMAFGSQVMTGVMEEKKNRIVEVILCSVRPFQLMMGKVIGIALVGLTQFLLWVVLGSVAIVGVQLANADLFNTLQQQNQMQSVLATKGPEAMQQFEDLNNLQPISELVQGIASINFPLLIGMFLFYFLIGYLLYATLFAAAGSLVDDNTDSQQFTLPITIPLLLTLLLLPTMMQEPSGSVAVWLSMIPFTSPVAMLFRIPFGVPIWQVIVSSVILLVTFPLCVWASAHIYRNSILMHDKRTWRWLFSLLHRK